MTPATLTIRSYLTGAPISASPSPGLARPGLLGTYGDLVPRAPRRYQLTPFAEDIQP